MYSLIVPVCVYACVHEWMCVYVCVSVSVSVYMYVCVCVRSSAHTWKTLGALTRLVRAEERVAAKIPAVINGPQPETIAIT